MIAISPGPTELILILLAIVLLFGGSQLPKLAKNLGKAQKEFKDSLAEGEREAAKAKEAAKSADASKSDDE